MKIAVVFSGQGSQFVGMGKDLYDNYPESKKVFDISGEVKDWCFNGPKELLGQTKYTQPALFTASIAGYEALRSYGVKVDAFAGFSLGEYSALVASGVMDFSDCLSLVKKRGEWMEQAVPSGGGMAAVIGDNQEILDAISQDIKIELVNFNSPVQTVIAGMNEDLEAAYKILKENKIKVIPLAVSGPFHSSYMNDVSVKIEDELKKIHINSPLVPIVSNVTGDYYENDKLISLISKQVKSPVRWVNSIEKLVSDGFDTFIEVGAGKTLCGLIKKIDESVRTFYVQDKQTLENTIAEVK